ncbi:859636b7-e13b-4103-9d22-fa9e3e47bc4f [Sclerotinia trifoliorum]|uniref:859636b7-e13b-4103-9d22-fa9e3e47bc4f n=1 Tax=Sclerotinia trifoliorum TaxID=28548 RepID=A0A8H2ZQS1_9HELO|nr:859636b7-e13b-4103-9d22-fa9e3e47bc4f [Sclerotinia trifoliorum]
MSDKDPNKGILDLPLEVQSVILKHTSTADLIALSLVSKHLRNLAAKELYRSFHIVFPDDNDALNDSPIDSLASGLDTFVTSDYDYSQHLKEIILEPLNGSQKGELAYRSYLHDTSCGKFMNTLLLLTLRKAKALESFVWDIRVKLSSQIFTELHRIEALQHFHVRMQAESSIHVPATNPNPTSSTNYNPSTFGFPPSLVSSQSSLTSTKAKQNGGKGRTPVVGGTSQTISGFKNLKSLAVLDMDTLDCLSEIRDCIQNSSSTLTSLELSFSELLASRTRKPAVEIPVEDDESEAEDEFGQLTALPVTAPDTLSDAFVLKGMTITEERKAQEAALAKILSTESSTSKGVTDSPSQNSDDPEGGPPEKTEMSSPLKMFVALMQQSAKAMAEHKFEEMQKIVQETIEKGSQVYLKSLKRESESSDKPGTTTNTEGNSGESSNVGSGNTGDNNAEEINGKNSESPVVADPIDETVTDEGESQDQPGLFDESTTVKKVSKSKDIVDPDDIDIEEPELVVDLECVEGITTETETDLEPVPMEMQEHQASEVVDELIDSEHMNARGISTEKREQTPEQIKPNEKGKSTEIGPPVTNTNKDMSEYIRKTRGLALENLSLYLIPIKSSVLSKAIDIRVLRKITLLNVGFQTSFWSMVARENRIDSLPLDEIYTDNVTMTFLDCIGKLAKVTELCMLERASRTKLDPTDSKKRVSIEQIRRLALKKHAPTLKVLSIHQESIPHQLTPFAWDLDAKTAVLLCRKAKGLEELAATFDVSVMHILNQNLSGLKNLRALHAIEFRSEDTCQLVRSEFRKFTVDSIAHNPDCELEYLALRNSITRIYRRIKENSPKARLPRAHLGKKTEPAIDSDSEDEGMTGKSGFGLKVESCDGFEFQDVQDVRIFEKDVVWKRL